MFEDIVKVVVIGLFTAIMVILLKNTKSELTIPLTIMGCIMIFGILTDRLASVINSLSGIYGSANLSGEEAVTLMKIMGIAYVTEFASSTCKDAEQTAIAGKIELAGRIFIVLLALPLAVKLLSTLKTLF